MHIKLKLAVLLLCGFSSVARAEQQTETIDCQANTTIVGPMAPSDVFFDKAGGSFGITVSTIVGCDVTGKVEGSNGMIKTFGFSGGATGLSCGERYTSSSSFAVTPLPIDRLSGGFITEHRNATWGIAVQSGPACFSSDGKVLYIFKNGGGSNGYVFQHPERPRFHIRTKSAGIGVRG